MSDLRRRDFLRYGSLGAAAWSLPAALAPTETSGELGAFGGVLAAGGELNAAGPVIEPPQAPAVFTPTEDNILGPYHRTGAPFRAKVTPPMEPGQVLVVRGRVWGDGSRKPLAGAVLDIWQANATGRYDNDDPDAPPAAGVFRNRARLLTDETGYYEFETIKPGRYKIGPDAWRPAHIHYLIRAAGHEPLVTQLYFRGDPENKRDRFIKPSLIIDPTPVKSDSGTYLLGTFDIILEKA